MVVFTTTWYKSLFIPYSTIIFDLCSISTNHLCLTGSVVRDPPPTLWRLRHPATSCWLTWLLTLLSRGLASRPSIRPYPGLKVIKIFLVCGSPVLASDCRSQPSEYPLPPLKPITNPNVFYMNVNIWDVVFFFSSNVWWHTLWKQWSHHLSTPSRLLSSCCGLQVDHQGLQHCFFHWPPSSTWNSSAHLPLLLYPQPAIRRMLRQHCRSQAVQ